MTRTRLARLRKASGLTQQELAAMTGLAQTKISDIERGRRDSARIPLETAAKLAIALDTHAEDLLDPAALETIRALAAANDPFLDESERE